MQGGTHDETDQVEKEVVASTFITPCRASSPPERQSPPVPLPKEIPPLPIPEYFIGDAGDKEDVDAAELVAMKVDVQHDLMPKDVVAEELSAMHIPCRIVVSGPESFNAAVKQMLSENKVDVGAITTLRA